MRGKNKKGNNEEEEPVPFAPPREPLEKPIKTPAEELADLKHNFRDKEMEYFPLEIKERYKKAFNLFDEDEDGVIDFDQMTVLFP